MTALYPYQKQGAAWLAKRSKALLADEMGLGKSAQAIKACEQNKAKAVLILCPASVRRNWEREIDKFLSWHPRTAVIESGGDVVKGDWVVCSYDLLRRKKIFDALSIVRWDALILDEAHYLKNRKAKRTKIVFGKDGLVRQARFIYGLTGTPAPNHPAELWPLLKVFGATRLSYWKFVRRFCSGYDNGFSFKITGAKNVPRLKQLLSPFILRRKKEDVLTDLPPIRFSDIVLDAEDYWSDEETKRLYGATRAELEETYGKEYAAAAESGTALTARKSDLPIATLRRLTGLAKVRPVAELVKEELEGGLDKIIIFCLHREVIEYLRQELRDFKPEVLFGGTPAKKRQLRVDRFNTNYKHRVFLGQIVAAGTGINLTAASSVLFAETSWVPAENQQAAMRAHRIGQKRAVLVRFASLAGSIDEHVQKVVRRKTETLAQIFG